MILIRSKDEYQNCSCQQEPKDEAFTVERLSNLAGLKTSLLEPSSDLVSRGAGVGSDEVTGTDSASDVASFGKVATVIPGGSEAGVSAGSDGGERNKPSLLGRDLQSPLRVDSLNIAKRNLDSSDHIVKHNAVISDLNTGSPEQEVAAEPQPSGQAGAFNQASKFKFNKAQGQSQKQNNAKQDGQVFAETGSKFHVNKTLGGI